MVVRDHVWKELLCELVVRDGVDLEGETEVVVGGIEDGLAAREAGVVDEDGGVADFALDGGSAFFDCIGGAEIAVEVVDIWWDYSRSSAQMI